MKYPDQIEDGSIPLHLFHSGFFFGSARTAWHDFPETAWLNQPEFNHAKKQNLFQCSCFMVLIQDVRSAPRGIFECVTRGSFSADSLKRPDQEVPSLRSTDDPNFADSHTNGMFWRSSARSSGAPPNTAIEMIFREVFKVTSTISQKHFYRIIEKILAILGNGPDDREDITLGTAVRNLTRFGIFQKICSVRCTGDFEGLNDCA